MKAPEERIGRSLLAECRDAKRSRMNGLKLSLAVYGAMDGPLVISETTGRERATASSTVRERLREGLLGWPSVILLLACWIGWFYSFLFFLAQNTTPWMAQVSPLGKISSAPALVLSIAFLAVASSLTLYLDHERNRRFAKKHGEWAHEAYDLSWVHQLQLWFALSELLFFTTGVFGSLSPVCYSLCPVPTAPSVLLNEAFLLPGAVGITGLVAYVVERGHYKKVGFAYPPNFYWGSLILTLTGAFLWWLIIQLGG